ncbi:hypothetical protein LTR86_003823 [Recurvomyces mirabilis]|nr:hypothetical protein LTR86_003823 [Recurvomyces mirabilis]
MTSGLLGSIRSLVQRPMSDTTTHNKTTGFEDAKMGQHPQSAPDWDNLKIIHRNILPPRASFYLYDNEKDALTRDNTKARAHSLSGKWKFHLANSPFEAPSGFEASSFDTSKWSNITVPGMWQLQNFGKGPHYTNVQYPFQVDPPHPPYTENECGSYVTRFRVPKHLEKDQLRLRFEGVDSAFHVWVNGEEVGYSQGSRNPSEFDITEFSKVVEENVLAVRVYQFCDGSYIEDQDQWWLSGIFRDVYLLGMPKKVRLEDFTAQSVLDEQYRDATLKVKVETSGACKVGLKLLDADRKVVADATETVSKDGESSVEFSIPVDNPQKWTAETPYLYTLVISLDESQFTTQRIGFRQAEIKDGLLKVNGKRIVIKGANRHEHHPESGRTVPYEFMKHDLLLMKTHNINAIRTCHQPNDPRMYELADELGFWVCDEADLECHGFETIEDKALPEDKRKLPFAERQRITRDDAARWTSDNPEWKDAYVDRAKQLVHRDKNHPCVIMWSLGNEAFYGRNHTAMYDWIKSEDSTRPIHYEPDQDAEHMDMYSRMYPQISEIIDLAENECKKKQKPLVLCEYVHAMGTGPGNGKEYQDAFYKYPHLQGGWVWEWANHGLITKTPDGTSYYGYGGDFGDVPNDGTFVMDGVLQSDHSPNSGLVEYKKTVEPVQMLEGGGEKVTIINRFDFATLDELKCVWSVVSEKGAVGDVGAELELPKGIEPGCSAILTLPKVDANTEGEAYMLLSFRLKEDTLWAKAGHEVAWCQTPLSPISKTQAAKLEAGQPPKTSLNATMLEIANNKNVWLVDIARGALVGWKKHGKEIVSQPLVPTFYRALTDNDIPQDGREWKEAFLHLASTQTRSVKWQESEGGVTVDVEQKFAPPVLSWSIDLTTRYTFGSEGSVQIHIKGEPKGKNLPKTLPCIGVTLGLSPSLKKAEWFGRGPGESYKDMKLSQKIGRHAVQSVSALWTGPEYPQDCSQRTDVRWVRFSELAGTKASITAEFIEAGEPSRPTSFDFMASHFDVKDIDEAAHPYELEKKAQEDVIVRLTADHHGLGTGSCGPKTLPQYALKAELFEFRVLLS